MSSRRDSVVATAESSAQGSRASTPANSVGGAPSVIDTIVEETDDDVVAAVKRDVVSSRTAAGIRRMDSDFDVHESSFIQQHARLDIAFLHAVSSHRPLGAHKHFNLIPILSLLDRAVRQIEADARDQEARDAAEDDEGSDADERGRSIKREDREPSLFDKDGSGALVITPAMIWQRLEELYDTEGLDELEDQAIDADSDSPFNKRPEPTYASHISRKLLGASISEPASFGFGNKLERLADVTKASTKADKKTARTKAAAAAAAAEDDEDEDDVIVDFELGPWEDYESLIAPRRLAVNAPAGERQENERATNEESIPAVARVKKDSSRQQSVSTDASIDGEEGDGEDDDEEQEEDEDEEDEAENDDDDDDEEGADEEEEEEKRPAKRKAAPAGNKKQGPASRQKRSGGSNATASSSATPTRASRSSAAQPRRSTRK